MADVYVLSYSPSNDPEAVALALTQYPAYPRVGGTLVDSLIFVGHQHEREAIPIKTLTGIDWDKLSIFSQKSNLSLIFGLNSLFRSGVIWDPTNTVELMKYSAQKGCVLDLEQGNRLQVFHNK